MTVNETSKSLINLSLYEKNPIVWDRIIKAGNVGLGELSKIVARPIDLDRAIGGHNIASKWHRGDLMPTGTMEKKALAYIENGYKPLPYTPLRIVPKVEQQPEVQEKDGEDIVLLVLAPNASKAEKAKALLKALGCTVTDLE
jgi:hypothetical protein